MICNGREITQSGRDFEIIGWQPSFSSRPPIMITITDMTNRRIHPYEESAYEVYKLGKF
jgi:hypothetical protein